jgi:hypothetical protein
MHPFLVGVAVAVLLLLGCGETQPSGDAIPMVAPTAPPVPTEPVAPPPPPPPVDTPPGAPEPLPSLPAVEGLPMTVSVDFSKGLWPVSPLAFGTSELAYSSAHSGDLDTDPVHFQRLAELNVDQVRFLLMAADPNKPEGPFVCAGYSCRGWDGSVSADGYIRRIFEAGAEPLGVVSTVADDIERSAQVAAGMVRYYKAQGMPIRRWVIDNEPELPNHGGVGFHTRAWTGEEYSRYFNAMSAAMKAVDPTIQIGGPCTSSVFEPFFRGFLAGSAYQLDFIDFHSYMDWRAGKSEEQLLEESPTFGQRVRKARALLREYAPDRVASVPIQVGEWNYESDPTPDDPRAFSGFTAIWGASAVGHILQEGGLSISSATKAWTLGLIFMDTGHGGTANEPTPLFHGLGMFTGEGLFRRFGSTLVQASSSAQEVEVWASTGEKNIVLVNKSPDQFGATLTLRGLESERVDVWTMEKKRALKSRPVRTATVTLAKGRLALSLPPYSVTTLVVAP